MMVRREVFQELGGFDASYGAYLEDVDLCWRAWLIGREVHYGPAPWRIISTGHRRAGGPRPTGSG